MFTGKESTNMATRYKQLQLGADLLISKQARGLNFGQSSKQRKGLLACLLIYCLYIVNLVIAVVGNRPLVFLKLISGG